MSKYSRAIRAETESRIAALDLLNTYACAADPKIRRDMEKHMQRALDAAAYGLDGKHVLSVWTDGSYDPKTGLAGIGVMIRPGGKYHDNQDAIAFGKPVKAKGSLEAEIYAVSIGLSYILDTFPDADIVKIKYDCTGAVACASNIDAFTKFGAPYTNFRSALKRVRKRRMTVLFEHVKAHAGDDDNGRCDLIAKKYAGIKLTPDQKRVADRTLRRGHIKDKPARPKKPKKGGDSHGSRRKIEA